MVKNISWKDKVYCDASLDKVTTTIHIRNRVFSHDFTAILVSQKNDTAAMLVSQTSPMGVELFSNANAFFRSNKFAYWSRGWKRSIRHFHKLQSWTKSLGQYCNIHIFLSFLPSFSKFSCSFFSPHPTQSWNSERILDTRVQNCLWGEGKGWTCVSWKTPQKCKSVPRLLSMIVGP